MYTGNQKKVGIKVRGGYVMKMSPNLCTFEHKLLNI